MTPTLSSFKTSFFTTSIIGKFRYLYACLFGLLSSSSSILCIHIAGDIPLISAIVHSTTFLCSRSTLINLSSSVLLNLSKIITERVSPSPKYIYFSYSGSGFHYSLGAYKIEGGSFMREIGRSIFGVLLFYDLSVSSLNIVSCRFLLEA